MRREGYRYVGPIELLSDPIRPGQPVDSVADLDRLRDTGLVGEGPLTFVVTTEGRLLVAPRESEHVACASAAPVLTAGEVSFVQAEGVWSVAEVTNQSTGYCPEPESYPAFAGAVANIGIRAPVGFTTELTFRLCTVCGERNVVRDDWLVCALCDSDLPELWNFAPR